MIFITAYIRKQNLSKPLLKEDVAKLDAENSNNDLYCCMLSHNVDVLRRYMNAKWEHYLGHSSAAGQCQWVLRGLKDTHTIAVVSMKWNILNVSS